MLLVHDDQSEVVMGEEQRGAGAEDHIGFGVPDGDGDLPSLQVSLFGMEHQDIRADGLDPVFKLSGKRNFRNQEEDAFSLGDGLPG